MALRLLIATNNEGKAREYIRLLDGLGLELLTPAQLGFRLDVVEDAETYEENATSKAKAFALVSGLTTLADDSGLEVDALGGEPGPRAKRFAGEDVSDEERVAFLLRRLEGVPTEKRTARFRCVIAIAEPEGEVCFAEGICEGVITFEPRGEEGFGYDPIFLFPELGKTLAELPLEEKNRISHRGRAAQKARSIIQERLSGGLSST